ncbi:MAG: stage II sporulation protein M [Halanaerobiales bacterium]|nr:stage II sporulation protein M [Halanaerobiales bacterium]
MNLYIRKRLPVFTFIVVVFILGISFGAIAVKTVDYSTKQNLFNYFNDFMQGYNEIEYDRGSLVSESIKFNLFNIFMIWAFGITVIMMPLITLLIFFKGFVLGFTVGFLVSEYSLKGIVLAISAVFFQNVLIIPSYIMAAVMAVSLSIRIIKYYRNRAKLSFEDFLAYTLEMTMLALITLGGALLETYISPLLLRLVLRFI